MNKYLLIYATIAILIFTLNKVAESAINNANKINLKDWKKVVLVYFHDFPQQYESLQNSPDCFFIPGLSTASDSIRKSVWRCRERISLLRPATLIRNWKQKQRANGAIDFNLPSAGINHVAAHIESVSSIANNILPVSSDSAGTEVVTGIFLRHSINVITYTFQSMLTGQLSKINATPEHLFYVKNRHAWIPLYKITAGMILTDNHNQPIRLLCPDDQRGHCGMPLYPGKITTIYNLEVYKKHVYFAGRQALLVHNTYYDDLHPKGVPDSLQTIIIRRLAEPLVSTSYHQMIRELFEYKVEASFADVRSVFFTGINKIVEDHNLRMKDVGLIPYKLGCKHTFIQSVSRNYSAYGFSDFSFLSPWCIYKPDYLEFNNKLQIKKVVKINWELVFSRESTINSDTRLWNLISENTVEYDIEDLEKYGKLVRPSLCASDCRKFKDTILKQRTASLDLNPVKGTTAPVE